MDNHDYRSSKFLRQHIQSILDFYEPHVDDPDGGFHQNFLDNGSVYDRQTRHLVSSTRFVFNYARAYLLFGHERYFERVISGIQFIRQHHLNPVTQGYYWQIKVTNGVATVRDDTNHCYGIAFVLLAYSWAYKAGMAEAKVYLEDTWDLLNRYYWDSEAGLYKDEFNGDFSICHPYRGQNANMHGCEALIAAFDATNDRRYLSRAIELAENIALYEVDGSPLIWEHYTSDWQIDWQYNKHDPKHLFRPWGYQPGHQSEWAKLLLMLHSRRPNEQYLLRAGYLFDQALAIAWDGQHGGIYYGFSPDHKICDDDKYFWVQAESFAAAARLAVASQNDKYWQWYDKIWDYAWSNFVDHDYGAWFRILSVDNQKLEDTKSPIGKTDYHTMGACYDVLDLLEGRQSLS